MQIVVEAGGRQREVDLHLEDPHACVADLVGVVGGEGQGIEVAGRVFPPEAELSEVNLFEGAVVRLTAAESGPPRTLDDGPAGSEATVAVVAGPAAGTRLPLSEDGSAPGSPVTVGRGEECGARIDDPSVSSGHCRLERDGDGAWWLRDLGSRNGTWVDGEALRQPTRLEPGQLARLGATWLRLETDVTRDHPVAVDPYHHGSGGLVPFNRPPRGALPREPEPVTPPEKPETGKKGRAFSIVMIAAPIILGTALVIIYQNPRFALFLLMSPIMAIGNWLSSRRQAKKENVANTREFRKALEELRESLDATAAADLARRRQLTPDLSEVLRRASAPSTRLWQRRLTHDDALRLFAGVGDIPWQPPLRAREGNAQLAQEVQAVLDDYQVLPRAPVHVDLADGGVVGIVGDRAGALALARALLVQAAVHHGPADVGVALLAAERHAPDWDWAKWLPHTRDEAGTARLLAADREQADALLAALLRAGEPSDAWRRRDDTPRGRTTLYVLDDVALTQGRRAPARQVLRGEAGPAAGIVVAETEDQLPSVTSTVVRVASELGDASVWRPEPSEVVDEVITCGLAEPAARQVARALARYEDPELEVLGAGVPRSVRLLPALGADDLDADTVAEAWKHDLPDPGVTAPLGVGEDGVVELDLARDGPHGLIGGTTGSGKSELLRSLVAGMAARADPEHLVFVLVDYKGGSAFDQCADLPHTVGMVTDLDAYLGERALRSLEAELGHRERVLRDAGCQDLPAYLDAGAPGGPMPRLVVVIDEFATLASELPDFVDALVGVAQRGRSLGVHLLLATQRPQGSVNANIKANTNLRVALRVQSQQDSDDIIDQPDAAELGRLLPGRAYVRLGPGDVELVQTPLSTAAAPSRRLAPVRLAPFPLAPVPPRLPGADEDGDDRPSDLSRLVAAAREAFDRSQMAPPRRPWLEMLPAHLPLDDVAARDDAPAGDPGRDPRVAIGLVDQPDQQRQSPATWSPAEGHLGVFGLVGYGTTTALRTVVRALAERHPPAGCHVHAVDYGAGELAALATLPHVGSVLGANDREGQERLVRLLRRELDRRRDLGAEELGRQPWLVIAVDGIGAFLAEYEGPEGLDTGELFRRVFAEGPTVRVAFVVAGDRAGELPTRMSSLVARKLLLRHADANEFASVGLRTNALPEFLPGRAVDGASHDVVQLAHPGDDDAVRAAAQRLTARWGEQAGAAPLERLPSHVALADLAAGARLEPEPMLVPLGLAEADLAVASLELYPTDHALVAGPPRSGKTTALLALAHMLRAADPFTVLVAVCSQRSRLYGAEPFDAAGSLSELREVVQSSLDEERRWVIMVDDAATVDDEGATLTRILGSQRPHLHVVAAARVDELRSAFAHWTRGVRQSRTGVLLQPNLGADGELLSTRLPRRAPVSLAVPGRGYLVNAGEATLVQLAAPADE